MLRIVFGNSARVTFHILNEAKRLKRIGMQQNSVTEISTTSASEKDHLTVTSANTRDPEIHDVRVQEIASISRTVKLVKLQSLKTPTPFSFKAGQWVDMFIPNLAQVGGFSITSSPSLLESKGEFHLAVKYSDSPPTKWVHTDCRVNDVVKIRVGGDFFLTREVVTSKLIFIAGGVGINPLASMISMLEDAKFQSHAGQKIQAALLFSAKTRDELIFKDQFDEIADSSNCFRPFYYVTAESLPNSTTANNVKCKRITAEDLHTVISDVLGNSTTDSSESETVSAYVCGPPKMIDAVKKILENLNVKNVYHEDWW